MSRRLYSNKGDPSCKLFFWLKASKIEQLLFEVFYLNTFSELSTIKVLTAMFLGFKWLFEFFSSTAFSGLSEIVTNSGMHSNIVLFFLHWRSTKIY